MAQICHIHVHMQTCWEPADDLRFHHWPDVLPKTTSGWLRVECLISGMLLIRTSFWVFFIGFIVNFLKCFMCLWILKVGVSSGNCSQKQLVTFLLMLFFAAYFQVRELLVSGVWIMFQLYKISLESAFSKWDRASKSQFPALTPLKSSSDHFRTTDHNKEERQWCHWICQDQSLIES